MDKLIKIVLATLFFICLADMPYSYFQLVRIAAVIGFAMLAYRAYERGNSNEMIIYLGLILLFQPIVKIALGREVWNIVDVVLGISLLISIGFDYKKKEN
jgi:hypothetical protein